MSPIPPILLLACPNRDALRVVPRALLEGTEEGECRTCGRAVVLDTNALSRAIDLARSAGTVAMTVCETCLSRWNPALPRLIVHIGADSPHARLRRLISELN
ncbi:MAG TPA: hypothetical protein VH682_24635 [Gemmataceae bacterium]|jgi:hypothetical protein